MPVEHIMGMPVRVAGSIDAVRVFAWLRWVDERFSTYRADSEISRLDRGEQFEPHPLVLSVLARCEELRVETGGLFDVRAGGRLDPSGYVKGWAVQRAAGFGRGRFLIDAGGDVLLRGDVAGRDPASVRAGEARRGAHAVGLRRGDLGRLRARAAHHRSTDAAAGDGPGIGDRDRVRSRDGGRLRDGRVRGRRPALDRQPRRAVDRRRPRVHDRDVASRSNSPGSVCQPPSQCWNARGSIVTRTSTSSPGSASAIAKPASQRGGRSIALSGLEA